MPLDHLVWAAPDLDSAMERFESLTGVRPRPGGSHANYGTRNALVPLQDHLYLEVLAPDLEQPLTGNKGEELAQLKEPYLETFCWAEPDLEGVAERAQASGLETSGPMPFTRTRPDGVTLHWRLLFLRGHDFGGLLPFFIDWQGSPHPSLDGAAQMRLGRLAVASPRADRLNGLYQRLGIDVVCEALENEGLKAEIETPSQAVAL
jgi:hypothetical protein